MYIKVFFVCNWFFSSNEIKEFIDFDIICNISVEIGIKKWYYFFSSDLNGFSRVGNGWKIE